MVWLYLCMDSWLYGCMAVWLHVCMAVWLYGYSVYVCTAVWLYGYMYVCLYGSMAPVSSGRLPPREWRDCPLVYSVDMAIAGGGRPPNTILLPSEPLKPIARPAPPTALLRTTALKLVLLSIPPNRAEKLREKRPDIRQVLAPPSVGSFFFIFLSSKPDRNVLTVAP
jgi:hypothetical protein